MGAVGAAAGVLFLVAFYLKYGGLMRRAGELPFVLAFVASRLFPRFEVEDPPVQMPEAG
jgi:hypothetical protein